MKQFLLLALLVVSPMLLAAQHDMTGSWVSSGETPEGESWSIKLTFDEDGTYSVDMNADGSVEVQGDYTIDGDQITLQDKPGDNSCESPGVYKFNVEGDNCTVTVVADDCPGRRETGKWSFTLA